MKISAFLAHLRELGVKVWAEQGKLRVSAPKGVLTDELKTELAGHKAKLLTLLEGARPRGEEQALEPVDRSRVERRLSFTQKRLWFLQLLEPELSAYNIPMSWTLRGPLDADALERALVEIGSRHEVLRSTFPKVAGKPTVRVLPPEALALERVARDPDLAPEAWRAEVQRRLRERAHRPFDLAVGPLFDACLVDVAPDEHVLFCNVHHTVFDGGSIARFLDELSALYSAFVAGGRSPLGPLPVQFADYADWQAARLAEPAFEAEVTWWKEHLVRGDHLLELPLDRPRPPVQTFVGARVGRPLDAELVARLTEVGRARGASLFMVLFAAYQVLLSRHARTEEVVCATPIDGRTHDALAGLIGFFANTLVLRTDLSGAPTFEELLARVRESCLGGYEHQDVPFERLVDELAPERNLAWTPLFQTMFLIEELAGEALEMGGVRVEPYALETHVARTDLMLYVYRDGGGWSAWAEYNTDLFERATVARLLDHYANLLAALAADPTTPVAELPLAGEDELATTVARWNDTAAAYPERTIHAQVLDVARRAPEAPALVFPTGTDTEGAGTLELSYRELDERSARLANVLRAHGAAPGQLVGLCLERSVELVVAWLAVQRTGAAYVPLDPAYPADRIAYMVADSGARLVLTSAELLDLVPGPTGAGAARLVLEELAAELEAAPTRVAGDEVSVDERMYVIYTSGSTGKPKGVEVAHRSVSNFLASMAREPGFRAGERLLAVTTLSFDIAVLELALPLVTGGTVVLASREAASAGDLLAALVAETRPDVMQATPATWRMLLLAGWAGEPRLRILSGGEALPRELADELLDRGAELWNLYGPTEATIWSTVERVEPGDGVVPIGRPIACTRIHVLDDHRRPQPLGVPGELWIAGDGLARGYLERPELTAERFVDDPFGGPGERMYRTGDLARWRADGKLECLGRVDQQVKLRGFRIELGEIESVLAEVEGVQQCVCVVQEKKRGDQRLVAFVQAAEPLDVEALREAARATLPAYMVPARFVRLEGLPLTPNGKVDRRALSLLEVEERPAAEHVAPRNDVERRIAGIWSESLGVERVAVDANFFDLGGHSLLLAEVHVRLQEAFDRELSIVELFQNPTVSALAAHLANGRERTPVVRGARRQRALERRTKR